MDPKYYPDIAFLRGNEELLLCFAKMMNIDLSQPNYFGSS